MPRFIGLFIGAGFGLIFVLLNSGSPLAPAVSLTLRVVAILALAGVVALTVLISRSDVSTAVAGPGRESRDGLPMNQFGTGYRIVVGAEIVLLFGGFQVLRLLDAPTETGVAWVALVVGVHFIAFLWVWKQHSILVPGVLLTGYGVAGLILANTSGSAWTSFVSGVLSGLTLLACTLAAAAWEYQTVRSNDHLLSETAAQA